MTNTSVKNDKPTIRRQWPRIAPAFVNTSNYSVSNTFLSDISSITFIMNLTGLLPVYRTISNYELGPPTRTRTIYWITAHALAHSITIYNLFVLFLDGPFDLFSSHFENDNITYRLESVLCSVAYTTTVFMCLKNYKCFLQISNDILKIDYEINQAFTGKIINDCGFSVKYLVLIAIINGYVIVLSVLHSEASLTIVSFITIGFYLAKNGLSSIFIIYISVLLRVVTVRFAYLNSIITCYTYKEQETTMKQRIRRFDNKRSHGRFLPQPPSMEYFQDDSLFIFRTYNKLLRLYNTINENFSIILVAYMGYAFYSITTTTYNLFVQITKQRGVSVLVLQLCFAYLFTPTAMLALLSRRSGEAANQANETSRILARVYNKSRENKNIIEKFLTKSIKQEVQFTAYGFFVIDNSTLFKIFSAVTTYLVILIQFKQLEESKVNDS